MTATFDPSAVRALAEILAATGLTEIEVEGKEGRIRVARAPAPVTYAAAMPAGPAPALPAAAGAAPEAVRLEAGEEAAHPGAVPSPMVGVVYLSPEPGAAPYVTIGQTVGAGQTLLLIEAMKTFNQIKAPRAGTVARLLVASGQAVEFGQSLIVLE